MENNDVLERRIAEFDLNAGGQQGYFVNKLAADNGWDPLFAERVREEYRRFIYLACTADHVVVPSDQVDAVWHQHLLDTEQYWDVFCEDVLGRRLHHHPNKGGASRGAYYTAVYAQTLQLYTHTFGADPPADIWPPATRRFGPDATHRRVATAQNWIVPKRRVFRLSGAVLVLSLTAPVVHAFVDLGLDVYCWSETPFVAVILLICAVAVRVSISRSRALKAAAAGPSGGPAIELDAYDAAAIRGDGRLAVNAAVAALFRDGAIGFDETTGSSRYGLTRIGELPPGAHPLACAISDAVAGGAVSLSDVHRKVQPQITCLHASLQERGLLRARHHIEQRFGVLLPLVVALILVMALVNLHCSDASVLILWLTLLTLTGVGCRLLSLPRVTSLGEQALHGATLSHGSTSRIEPDDIVDGRGLSWAVALRGPGAVSSIGMYELYGAIDAPESAGGGGVDPNAGCG